MHLGGNGVAIPWARSFGIPPKSSIFPPAYNTLNIQRVVQMAEGWGNLAHTSNQTYTTMSTDIVVASTGSWNWITSTDRLQGTRIIVVMYISSYSC